MPERAQHDLEMFRRAQLQQGKVQYFHGKLQDLQGILGNHRCHMLIHHNVL